MSAIMNNNNAFNSTMSGSSSHHGLSYPTESQDRLEALFRQEMTFYLTSEYLSSLIQRRQQQQQQNPETAPSAEEGSSNGGSRMLNQHWREVMCEWAYHGTCFSLLLSFLYVLLFFTVEPFTITGYTFKTRTPPKPHF